MTPTQGAPKLIHTTASMGMEGWRREKKAQTQLDLKPTVHRGIITACVSQRCTGALGTSIPELYKCMIWHCPQLGGDDAIVILEISIVSLSLAQTSSVLQLPAPKSS